MRIYVRHLWVLTLFCVAGYMGLAYLGFVKIENAYPAAIGVLLFTLIATGHAWLWNRAAKST